VPQSAHTGSVPAPTASTQRDLPPLILHPISHCGETLTERSAGDNEALRAEARRLELRMLCCLGKDLTRWLGQCVEFAAGDPALASVSEGHFMDLLVDNPPENVTRKMHSWGVIDFRTIFARALGLCAVLPNPPAREQVSDTFVRDFARYADALYRARRLTLPSSVPTAPKLQFEVYASGEYAQMLEKSWGL
jgi:hypothetical protein